MKKIFFKIVLGFTLLGFNLANVFAITLQVPTPSGQEDIVVTGPTQVESNESTIFDIIQIINDYLWFSIAGIAMVVLISAGIKLILAEGDKEKVSSANRMVISSIIAIFVAMVSYAIIKLVINLF
ncbi:MAG TPA: hypothetical protein VJ892_02910 [Candidatus Absconditabacterales bacterium]|nr:hypothetical protein [Candidatus Absconditabacterales bacterium]